MKKTLWFFRSNLKNLEYYHAYKDLNTFENNCHDFYLLQLIWLLRHNYFDSIIVWRIGTHKDIVFNINNGQLIQRWVRTFEETFKYDPPLISFFRGGFKEYDNLTKQNPGHFGKKLYLGSSKRVFPKYGGKYNYVLVEDEKEFKTKNSIPFYKTANDNIFKPLDIDKKYDLCFPCNFSQIRYKGQEFFINEISKSSYLKSLKIVHVGNKPEIGISLAKKYNVKNIKFVGSVERPILNKYLNKSKSAIVLSNKEDGCPRIITEVLQSGTPLILRDITRILPYYKNYVTIINQFNFEKIIKDNINNFEQKKIDLINNLKNISIDTICKKNINLWKK